MAQYGREYFKKQFEGLPPKAVAVIALRAAMRVFPVLAQRGRATDEAFWFWPAEDRARHTHLICRCFQSSALVNSLTKDAAARDVAAASAAATTPDAAVRAAAVRAAAFAAAFAVYAAVYADVRDAAARDVAAASAADAAADAATALADAATAILTDIAQIRPSWIARQLRRTDVKEDPVFLLAQPLWPEDVPAEAARLWTQLQSDLRGLGAGFEIWIDWYQDRLNGKSFNWEIERQWALLSKEQLSQSPAEINAYLKGLREGALTKELKRVRAIFIGHGDAGKTSLIRALHGEDVIQGKEPMTQGIAIKDAALSTNRMDEQAGVFTSVTDYKDDDLTVHFWDFGGQVMAHATHQFFLRCKCLYVVVLAGRAERNPNEEAEYWLEHVRAFGDNAPVLLVGNKADVMQVNLDLTTLKQKFPNIAGFYSLSCTQAKGAFKDEFELFRKKFEANLKALGQNVQRFSPEQFKVLKTIEQNAAQDDFLNERRFDEICKANGIAMEGPGGRDSSLDIFDKLGIVMHFERLPFLTDYVLNPRWLTYGVYTIMYSEEAKTAKGRLSEAGLVSILNKATWSSPMSRNAKDVQRLRPRADADVPASRVGQLDVPAAGEQGRMIMRSCPAGRDNARGVQATAIGRSGSTLSPSTAATPTLIPRATKIYTAVLPPSTGRIAPWMKLARSVARNTIASAISSGAAVRPAGACAASCYSAPPIAAVPSVRVGPGLTAFTRTPLGPYSAAHALVNRLMAALLDP
jgi:signal recognition particle receptor subunit beta